MKTLIFTFISCIILQNAFADSKQAFEKLVRGSGRLSTYQSVVKELVEGKLYFTSVPFIKEILTRSPREISSSFDSIIDEVITYVGVRQLEVLPVEILNKSSAPTIKYILAKKLFRIGQYKKSLEKISSQIASSHPIKPFALQLQASSYSLLGEEELAKKYFSQCSSLSDRWVGKVSEQRRKRQYQINRDNCILGVPRSLFAQGRYDEASLAFLDLPKSSPIWPEVLFEEAWNSFYQRDYNRTLGKLVSYKAPLLDFIFNPEVEVLKSLTYMELCLFNDAGQVVEDFYSTYQDDTLLMKKLMKRFGSRYDLYYKLAKKYIEGSESKNDLLNRMMKSILRDPSFREMYESFKTANSEVRTVSRIPPRSGKDIFFSTLKDALVLQRDLIGAYVRKRLLLGIETLNKSFEGMSYINLEILDYRKNKLFDKNYVDNRKRGDIRNLKKNSKQYFWTFNGEFWADELGDYVFSLKSECKDNEA